MASPALPGWKRVGGTSRNYINTLTGQQLPRRQYDKLAHALAGVQPMAPQHKAKAIRGLRNYQRLVNKRVEEARAKGPIATDTKRRIRNAQDTQALYRELTRPRRKRETDQQVNTRKRAALKALGYRTGIPDWVPPGQSDAYRRGTLRRSDLPRAVSATFA